MTKFLLAMILISAASAKADSCTVLDGGRELLSARKTVQVGSAYYDLAITMPDLISQPGSCVSKGPAGVIDPVLSMASMGKNTFSLPSASEVQVVVSRWDGANLNPVAQINYSTLEVSVYFASVLIIPEETAFYDFSDARIVQGDFASLPKAITSFYEVNYRFFLASGPASFAFHEPDPSDPNSDSLTLQADDAKFQVTPEPSPSPTGAVLQ
jgi:hypothetical protein